MGMVPPRAGLQPVPLTRPAPRHGALFVSDEVMTGFRVTRSGRWGLDGAVEGWRPDLMTFGKVMGGGFPAAAFGGRADVMAHLAPEGAVYQAGTLSGNPVAATAGLTTLRLATDEVYAHVDRAARGRAGGRRPRRSPRPACRTSRRPTARCSASSSPSRRRHRPVRDFAGASRQRADRFAAFFHAMLDQGVYLPPSAFEVVVPLRRARRRGPRPGRRRAARRRAAPPPRCPTRPSATRTAMTRPSSTCSPRRGPQPDRHPLRPAARLPALRARPADGDSGSPRRSPTATSPHVVASPLERAQQTAQPLADALGLDIAHRRAGHRVREQVRGQDVRRRPGRAQAAPRLAAPVEPVAAVVGRALQAGRRADGGRRQRRPRRAAAGTRRSSSPTSCRSG